MPTNYGIESKKLNTRPAFAFDSVTEWCHITTPCGDAPVITIELSDHVVSLTDKTMTVANKKRGTHRIYHNPTREQFIGALCHGDCK